MNLHINCYDTYSYLQQINSTYTITRKNRWEEFLYSSPQPTLKISNTKDPHSSSSPVMSDIPGIMRKAIQFPLSNKKFLLHVSIPLLFLLFFLVLLHSFIATPLIAKVEDGYESFSLNYQDLISLVLVEIPFAFTLCLVLLFASDLAILASVATHQGKSIGLMEMLQPINSKWKGFIVSGLYVSFLMTSFIGATIGLTRLISVLFGVLAALSYPYLASICNLVLVISMVEDEHYEGETVLHRAREIIARRRFQGYFLMFSLMLLSIPVYVLFYVTSIDDDDENDQMTQFCFLLVATVLFYVVHFYNNMVYTMFYLELTQRGSEKIEFN